MPRSIVLLAAAAAAVVTLSGCSQTVSGTASPEPHPSANVSVEDSLKALDACAVLAQLVEGQGFEPGVRKTVRNECHASKADYGTYSLALDPYQGLAEFEGQATEIVPLQINGREGREGKPGIAGMCEVALEVGEHARALTAATMTRPGDDAKACPAARDLAAKVEPLLPEQQ
ncbi:hypothetical protein GCM10027445_59600 [Amycolatopsis endophytica]|uniref:DUF3558 domain-containing protein n=1 Tax=Amycolatopsis endophytica TaxID=860233 RepID=A0A853AXR3_9PSEU|nr:DUF3558 domain-containing protein [Amycolatopsis endophytica]NYI87543.1 hypothetical protein [Amycolatopsis endophytica]